MDKNPKHPLKKKKVVAKTCLANAEDTEAEPIGKKKKHTY